MRRLSLVLTMLVATLGACERRSVPVSLDSARGEDAPVHESWDAHLALSRTGVPRLEVSADYMAEFQRGDSTFVLMSSEADSLSPFVRAVVFGDAGDTTAVVRAQRIYWYEEDDRLEAHGNVVVDGANGHRIESEYLEWDDAARTVHTPGFARITMEGQVWESYGLDADEGLDNIELRDVRSTIEVTEE